MAAADMVGGTTRYAKGGDVLNVMHDSCCNHLHRVRVTTQCLISLQHDSHYAPGVRLIAALWAPNSSCCVLVMTPSIHAAVLYFTAAHPSLEAQFLPLLLQGFGGKGANFSTLCTATVLLQPTGRWLVCIVCWQALEHVVPYCPPCIHRSCACALCVQHLVSRWHGAFWCGLGWPGWSAGAGVHAGPWLGGGGRWGGEGCASRSGV